MKPKTLRALRASFCLTLPLAAADKPPPDSFPADAPAQSFLMIGNGHIDPVWLWPWQEGVNLVHSTFRSALDRLNENPDFTFTASSAQFYEWVAQNDPAMLAEIKQRVAEGRWGLVGGWWIEPDLNIPSGEALVRHGLYGQRSFQKLLGRKAVTGFNPDGFGHPGSLPQILRGQGLENYVFMRPNPKENAAIPASTFRWRSPDGSDVLAYRIPVRYGDDGSANIRKDLLRILKEFPVEKEPFPVRMAFYGVGDHGGGATKATLAAIRSLQTDPAAPKLSFSTPDAFFAQIRNRTAADNSAIRTNSFNSTFSDELQHHAVGCYSAHAEIKKNNRAAETALVTAEKLTAIGALAWGAACPRDALTTAWEAVLFQQFHDILAGTSLPGHYAAARDAHGHALHTANQASWLALQKLAWQIPTTDPESEYVLVFNPHPWPATLPVEIEVTTAQKPSKAYRLFPEVIENAAGEPVPFQTAPASTVTSSGRRTFVFNAKLPPFGWEQFRLRPLDGKKRDTLDTALIPQTDTTLENAFLAVTFDPDGRMTLRDKTTGATLVRDASAIVMEDRTDTWGHRTGPYDRETYDKQIGEFTGAELRVLEHGPVRKTIRVTTRYNNSTLSTDWTLNAGEPAL
ncbi:MAG: hypothetical protein LBR12_04980, partial [Opitutaceae bacterium]|nr:hypothetical protein [Opitutaceae bacterium]